MDFGKLYDLSDVDFSMPEDPTSTTSFLYSQKGSGKLLLGATAWADRAFVGKLYPSNAKTTDYLYHYARQFNTVELNSTHYSIPSTDQLRKWREKVPDAFRFCPKLPQSISHRTDLGMESGQLAAYLEVIPELEENLGLQFMQLSPRFGPEITPVLQTFLESWPAELPLAMEFRHPGWFKSNEIWEILLKANIGTVITDVSGRRDVLHMEITSPNVMVRFVGNALHETDYERLNDWIRRIDKWIKHGETIYFMPHQPELPELIDMCLHASERMNNAGLNAPKLKSLSPGKQQSLF